MSLTNRLREAGFREEEFRDTIETIDVEEQEDILFNYVANLMLIRVPG